MSINIQQNVTTDSPSPVESQLPLILGTFQTKLQEIDALERRLAEKVAEKRVRALTILDELPAIRSSTLRIYITHQFDQETQYVPIPVPAPVAVVAAVDGPVVPAAAAGPDSAPGSAPIAVPGPIPANATVPPAVPSGTPAATATATAGDPVTGVPMSIPAPESKPIDPNADANTDANANTTANMNTTANETSTPTPREEMKVNKWKTIIEGKLLVSHLDHQSAAMIEQASKTLAAKDARIYQTQNDQQALDTADMTSRERTATRFMHDREGEEAIASIKFGHFFDRVSVTFETFQKDLPPSALGSASTSGSAEGAAASSSSISSKRSKRSSFSPKAKKKKITIPKQKQNQNEKETPPAVEEYTLQGRKNLCWNQFRATNPNTPKSPPQQTMDTHAFHAFHTEESEPIHKENMVVATIRLYRKDLRDKYKPSDLLCKVLLPFLPMPTAATNAAPVSTMREEGHDVQVVVKPPRENHVQIPTLLTMDEALGAVHFYIRQHHLWKEEDVSLIRNDGKLEELFGCKEMAVADVKQLLWSRGLLIPTIIGTPGDSPVVLTYIMKKETASVRNNGMKDNDSDKGGGSDQTKTDDDSKNVKSETSTLDTEEPVPKKRRTVSPKEDTSDVAMEDESATMFSCDIDIDVAHLYHSKCRDILRRIKIREYEYTSCRTRALRTVEQTKASEDTIKDRLENIVRQKGLTSGHQPILAALAKEAPEGSEARIVAHLDARTALLVDRLETHCQQAHACWDIVNKCGGSV
jgi:hypothetical protein